MTVRYAQAGDASGIAGAEKVTWEATYRGLIPDSIFARRTLENRTTIWNALLSDSALERLPVFVAQDTSGKVIGFCYGGKPLHPFPGYDAELIGLYVLPEYQRQGHGGTLLRRLALELQKAGGQALIVWVLRDSKYRLFYEKVGGKYLGDDTADFGERLIVSGYGWPQISHFANLERHINENREKTPGSF